MHRVRRRCREAHGAHYCRQQQFSLLPTRTILIVVDDNNSHCCCPLIAVPINPRRDAGGDAESGQRPSARRAGAPVAMGDHDSVMVTRCNVEATVNVRTQEALEVRTLRFRDGYPL